MNFFKKIELNWKELEKVKELDFSVQTNMFETTSYLSITIQGKYDFDLSFETQSFYNVKVYSDEFSVESQYDLYEVQKDRDSNETILKMRSVSNPFNFDYKVEVI